MIDPECPDCKAPRRFHVQGICPKDVDKTPCRRVRRVRARLAARIAAHANLPAHVKPGFRKPGSLKIR
jgi:hypothetical protein